MTPDEFQAIAETIRSRAYDDRALIPECFQHALDTLHQIADASYRPEQTPVSVARQSLRRMVLRAESGVPFDEPPHTEENL